MTYPKGYTPPNPYHVDNFLEIYYYEDGNMQSARINPWSFSLNHGEALLWDYASNTKGIIRKKVIARMVVTNFRAFVTDEENHRVDGYALLPGIDDVIVMNTRRVSDSIGYAVYAGRYGGFAGPRFSSGTSKTIGDLVFIINGQQSTWGNIPDPNGLKSFIKSIKKTMYDPLTKIEQKKPRGRTTCSQCGIQNTRNARFCSGCGSQLLQMCSTCKKLSPIGSSFCSNCGYPLVISQTIEIKEPSSDKRNIEVVETNFRECMLKEYNIKINYPSNWVRTTNDSNPQVKAIFEAPKEVTDQLPDAVEVSVDNTVGEMTLVTSIKNMIKNIKESCPDFELIESTPSTLSGIPAHQIIFSSSQKMAKALIVVTIKNKVAYWVTYIADPNRYLKYLSSAEQMISSFEILN